MTLRDLPGDHGPDARRLTVPNLERALELSTGSGEDAALRSFFECVGALLERHGRPTDVEVRLVTGAGADGDRTILELGVLSDEPGTMTAIVAQDDDDGGPLEALLTKLEAELADEVEAGADSPLTAPTGERLLDEAAYAGMRRAVLEVSRALGAIEEELFDALIATAERSVGPGLEQAVAAGEVPLDRLGPAREALELELRLFRCARTFRTGVGSVQDAVRRHQQAEEERAGAPPAIEVIRHNAPKNGGGT